MWQCPFHPSAHVRPGKQCATCVIEIAKKEREERAAKEQEENKKKKEEKDKWFREEPGRREDKPRHDKPGKNRVTFLIPEVEAIQQEEVAGADAADQVSHPFPILNHQYHILTTCITSLHRPILRPRPPPHHVDYTSRLLASTRTTTVFPL